VRPLTYIFVKIKFFSQRYLVNGLAVKCSPMPYPNLLVCTEAKFLVWLRYDAGTILETMPKLGYDHRTAFSEKQQGR
jgi:hypothetical protein